MKNIYILTLIAFLISTSSFSQKNLIRAISYEEAMEFSKAIEYYNKVLKDVNALNFYQKKELYFGLGNCYMNINDYESAKAYYTMSLESELNTKESYYQIGIALLGLCDYNGAISAFQKSLVTKTDAFSQSRTQLDSLSLIRIEMASKAYGEMLKLKDVKVINVRQLNTEFSEYGIYYNNSRLFFSSMRKEGLKNKTDYRTSQGYSDIYYSVYEMQDENQKNKKGNKTTSKYLPPHYTSISTWSKPKELPSPYNSSKFNEGTISIDYDNNIAYVMQCNGVDGQCDIWAITIDENLKAESVQKTGLNSDIYNVGHPCLTSNGKRMYFISDMPGGFGGTDIWFVDLKNDGNWNLPRNAGTQINTANNEMFPSIYNDSLLIFASSGHKGYGGLDLYFSHLTSSGDFSEPVNFEHPINSGADDFSMIFSKDLKGGFFCSNRPGGIGSDDIYSFIGNPFTTHLIGSVTDISSKLPVVNAFVIISVPNEFSDTLRSSEDGTFDYQITPGKRYVVDIYKDGYSQNISTVYIDKQEVNSVFKYSEDNTQYVDVDLMPNKTGFSIQGTVTESETQQPVIGQQMILVGTDGYFDQALTNDEGEYYFGDFAADNNYIIMMASQKYWTRIKVLDVPKLTTPKTFSKISSYNLDFEAVEINTNSEIIIHNIYYEFDKAILLDSSKHELNKIVQLLKENPHLTVEISSHTDERGNEAYNYNLSQRRAQAVVDYLISQGIQKSQLVAKGYGKSNPIIVNASTEEEHLINRRTAFKVIRISEQNIELIVESIAPQIPGIQQSEIRFSSTNSSRTQVSSETSLTDYPIVYKVQIAASKTSMNDDSFFQKALANIPELKITEEKDASDGLYRYFAGEFADMSSAVIRRNQLKQFGYQDCFVRIYQTEDSNY